MSRFDQSSREEICERFADEAAVLARVLDFADRLGARLDGTDLGGRPVEKFFFLFQFAKALKTTRAIELLFFGGFDEDSQVLLRVLIEQAIVVRWVHQENPQERAVSYAHYAGERQYKHLEVARSAMPDLELPAEVEARIQDAHKKYVALDKADKWLTLTRNVAELAASVGMVASYPAHLVGSDFIHSNPTRETDYVEIGQDELRFNTLPCMPKYALTPIFAAHHLLIIADVLNDDFALESQSELQSLMAETHAAGCK